MEYEDVKPGMLFKIIEIERYADNTILDERDEGHFLILDKKPYKFSALVYRNSDPNEIELYHSNRDRWRASTLIWSRSRKFKDDGYRFVLKQIFEEPIKLFLTAD